MVPRAVLVRRATDYELLLAQHGTAAQARFFLSTRGQDLDALRDRHERVCALEAKVTGAIPRAWRRARVDRSDLHRFLFEPDDVVVAFGQDGLVANLAKYLQGQWVIGINPEPERNAGVLVPCLADHAADLLPLARERRVPCEHRTMVEARLDDGQRLLALNEIFIGHERHQSARYHLAWQGQTERQSSSGVIVTTGTGSTGWAASIHRNRATDVSLPFPDEDRVAYFVREAYPSVATGCDLTDGSLRKGEALVITSRMNDGGVVFGDGIEEDRLAFGWGKRVTVRMADRRLALVNPASPIRAARRRPKCVAPPRDLARARCLARRTAPAK